MAVTLKEAVATLESGNWVSLRLFQANIAKNSGGKVLELLRCKIARRQPGETGSKSASGHSKNPEQRLHFTRNVQLQNGDIITIHPILIQSINNGAVL